MSRETHRAEKIDGYFDFKQLRLHAHINVLTVLYKSCAVATPENSEPSHLENYVRIVAFASSLRRASFHSVAGIPSPQHHCRTSSPRHLTERNPSKTPQIPRSALVYLTYLGTTGGPNTFPFETRMGRPQATPSSAKPRKSGTNSLIPHPSATSTTL